MHWNCKSRRVTHPIRFVLHRRVLLFPRGNQRKYDEALSVYLDCPDLDQEEPGWTLRTEFHITLVHPDNDANSVHKSALLSCWHSCCCCGAAGPDAVLQPYGRN